MVDRGDVDALVEIALQRFGRVDILVNNAGSNVPQSVESIVDEDWDRTQPVELHEIDARARSADEGTPVGPCDPHLIRSQTGL